MVVLSEAGISSARPRCAAHHGARAETDASRPRAPFIARHAQETCSPQRLPRPGTATGRRDRRILRWQEVGETVTRLLADRLEPIGNGPPGNCPTKPRGCSHRQPWSQLPAEEQQACERWAPLVACLDVGSWSKPERKALFEVMRAKGGSRESEFVAKFDAHQKLRAAFRALPGSSPE